MAEVKRTWSVPTSPRSPYKLADELNLLSQFEGQEWSRATQRAFAEELGRSDFFEGSIYQREPDFSARDRINRSPKTFGFVRFDHDNRIEITDAGRQLISNVRPTELFLRQLIKWQYPSPKHSGASYEGFKIKPFLEVLRLANELNGLTKKEIAIFCIPFIDYNNYETIKSEIVNFRDRLASLRGVEKKRFLTQFHLDRYRSIYHSEIESGNFRIREQGNAEASIDSFVKTKARNSIDYADAAIRYFRATGLFTISSRTFRLKILDTKQEIVESILANTDREPDSFINNESSFLDIMCNPSIPVLPQDDRIILKSEISSLLGKIAERGHSIVGVGEFSAENIDQLPIEQLKDRQESLEALLKNSSEIAQIQELQSYDLFDDISDVFKKISDRKDTDIPDKPLFFEWNTWRALNMLDDGEIKGNLSMDTEGQPLHAATGGMPDIICYYRDFVLVVEVTLTSGSTQFTAEGESVPRHLGDVTKSLRTSGDDRPVFGMFVALNLNDATIAHFYSLRRTEIAFYGGRAKIIPIDIATFQKMLEAAKNVGGVQSRQLYSFLQWVNERADTAPDENVWYSDISTRAREWVSTSIAS